MRLITAEQGRHPEEEGEDYELTQHHPRLHHHHHQYLKGDHHSLHNDDEAEEDDGGRDDDRHSPSPSPSLTASHSLRSSPCPTMATPSPPLSDTEECEVDPFCHKLQLTKWQWIRSVLLAFTLFPLRVIMVMTCVVTAWSLCLVATWGMTEEDMSERPLTGWRKRFNHMSMFLGRRVTNSAGFIVNIKGRQASPEEAPILTVAPHSTYFDGLVVFWSHGPYIVSRKENRSIPFIGKCIECAQTLLVSREDPQSRQNTVKEILRRSEPDSDWPQLVIFPEGSTANRKALMSFKPGAFYPARPVQPVVIRYPNKLDTVTWTWNQSHGAFTVLWLTMSQVFTRAEIEYLPVYHPNEEEKADAKLYAKNVRKVMSAALGVPTSDVTYEEIKAKYGKKSKKTTSETKKSQ